MSGICVKYRINHYTEEEPRLYLPLSVLDGLRVFNFVCKRRTLLWNIPALCILFHLVPKVFFFSFLCGWDLETELATLWCFWNCLEMIWGIILQQESTGRKKKKEQAEDMQRSILSAVFRYAVIKMIGSHWGQNAHGDTATHTNKYEAPAQAAHGVDTWICAILSSCHDHVAEQTLIHLDQGKALLLLIGTLAFLSRVDPTEWKLAWCLLLLLHSIHF